MSASQLGGLLDQGSLFPQWSSEASPKSASHPGSAIATSFKNEQPCGDVLLDGEYHEHEGLKDPPIKVEESRESTDADSALSASDNENDQAENAESPASLTEQYNLKRRMKRFRYNECFFKDI